MGQQKATEKTAVGAYFVSNYPPYSYWCEQQGPEAKAALDQPPVPDTPLGIYLHIPFCRKRCKFCYFRVYTDKPADEIQRYLDGVVRELELYAAKAVAAGRKPKFIYFGGGTPSYISTRQLSSLVEAFQPLFPWDEAEEVTFECEPGTITEKKLQILHDIGVTRLSLGVEHFDDEILELNGRAHGSKEIERAYGLARKVGFPQINIDLIAGMVGETESNWQMAVERAISMDPDNVTIYQMELPRNTVISKEMRIGGKSAPVADWDVKRGLGDYAFREFERADYSVTSGYTVVKDPAKTKFVYRDSLWSGADMLGVGVSSFSHVQGVHFQNDAHIEPYLESISAGEIPIKRALVTSSEERMIREFILQMKKGRVDADYFRRKFEVDLVDRFSAGLVKLRNRGMLEFDDSSVTLTRGGLLRVDESLHQFFLPQHRVAAAP